MQQQYQYKYQEYNKNIIKWIHVFDNAICQVYKQLGKYRIEHIYNEICEMNKTFQTNTDEEINEFVALIDIKTNQIARIQHCQKYNDNANEVNYNGGGGTEIGIGIGIRTLFHEHHFSKTKQIFSHFISSYNNALNISIEKYVDEFGNINATHEGFDYVYENVFIKNSLFNTSKTAHIRNELVMLRAPIIIQMCKYVEKKNNIEKNNIETK